MFLKGISANRMYSQYYTCTLGAIYEALSKFPEGFETSK
jgi:hypothetical protein